MYTTEKENKLPYNLGSSIKEVFSDYFFNYSCVWVWVWVGVDVFML